MMPDPLHPALVHLPIAFAVLAPFFAAALALAIRSGALSSRFWAAAVLFQALGHATATATDGPAALSAALQLRPDLVVLDIGLPQMSGLEVLRQLKSTPILKRLPVIILTSSKQEGDLAMGYDGGANSYIVKPVSFSGFLEVIKQIEGYWISLNVGPPDGRP